ncbi:MAG: GGDEF domain-containing protein [Chloroflexota bacterium]
MLRTALRRYGLVRVSIALTLIAILLSVILTYGLNWLLGGEPLQEGWIIAIVAPAIIAPILGVHTLQLLNQLDQAEQRLQLLSHTDELTQTYNRRYFMQFGEQELQRAFRYANPFSIAIMDLDNFKAINDGYGHLAGDQVLLELSRLCAASIRKMDIFARYGGDEFIFLFPYTDREQARELADRIFQKISSTPIHVEEREIRLLFSMGVTTFHQQVTTLDDLLAEADHALYQAKKSGGNKFICAFDQ